MQDTSRDITRRMLALEFTKQLESLSTNFIDFRVKFEHEMIALREKSRKILELLKNNCNNVENDAQCSNSLFVEAENNMIQLSGDQAKQHEGIIKRVTQTKSMSSKLNVNNSSENDEDNEIEKICDVDKYLDGILKKTPTKPRDTPTKKNSQSVPISVKTEEKVDNSLEDEDEIEDSPAIGMNGIVKDTDDEQDKNNNEDCLHGNYNNFIFILLNLLMCKTKRIKDF